MKNTIIFILIFIISLVLANVSIILQESKIEVKTTKDLELENFELKETIKEQDNYINWQDCIADSTIDCHTCDSLYNPNGEFIY